MAYLESQVVKLSYEKNHSITQKEKVFQNLFEEQESKLRLKEEKIKDITASLELCKIENENHQENLNAVKEKLVEREEQLRGRIKNLHQKEKEISLKNQKLIEQDDRL